MISKRVFSLATCISNARYIYWLYNIASRKSTGIETETVISKTEPPPSRRVSGAQCPPNSPPHHRHLLVAYLLKAIIHSGPTPNKRRPQSPIARRADHTNHDHSLEERGKPEALHTRSL